MKKLKKIKTISIIVFGGLLLALSIMVIKDSLISKANILLDNKYIWGDFIDTIKYSVGIKTIAGNYLPFTYIIMRFLSILSFGNYKAIFFVVFILSMCTSFYLTIKLIGDSKSKKEVILNIFVIFLFQFPMIFEFIRGNIEIINFLFCMIFYYLYKKEKYTASAIFLAMAVCMKLYPALYAFLFISKKQYKPFFACVGTSIGLTIISYVLMIDILGSIPKYIEGFKTFTDRFGNSMFGMQFNHSILFGIYYMLHNFVGIKTDVLFASSIMHIYTICIGIISVPLCIYTTCAKIPEWKKICIFTLMILSFPLVSFDYTLIFMIIPITSFALDDTTSKWEDGIYSVFFALLLIPINIGEEVLNNTIMPNYGVVIKPTIIIFLILMIIATDIVKRIKRNKLQIGEMV